jgi:hypothetical protein
MELYSSFIKLAPLLILKLLATGAFGASEHDQDRHGRVALAGHVMLMVAVVGGGFVSILVLGDVMPPTAATRWVLIVAGCLSLLLLANFKLGQIATLYRARPHPTRLEGTSGGASADAGKSS